RGARNASIQFAATGGTTYYILAGGYNGASGNLSLTAYGVVNDICSMAMPLSSGAAVTLNTSQATGTGDPTTPCSSGDNGVWFTFTPASTGPVTISTCGSSFDTVLAVYTGACGALSPIRCNDDNGPSCAGRNASGQFQGAA